LKLGVAIFDSKLQVSCCELTLGNI
jgi:hypothetical protein